MNTKIMLSANEEMNGLFTNMLVAHQIGLCPFCRDPIGEFRDALSLREFKISGLCQSCQDSVFNLEENGFEDQTKIS